MRPSLAFALRLGLGAGLRAQEANIPALTWEPRSHWVSVRDFGARGDGTTDDSPATQGVLDRTPETDTNCTGTPRHRVVHFPAGRYRITRTLSLERSHGMWPVGHGRDTVLE